MPPINTPKCPHAKRREKYAEMLVSTYCIDLYRELKTVTDDLRLEKTAISTNWCRRRDSNSHDLSHNHLKVACLPIPPRRHF